MQSNTCTEGGRGPGLDTLGVDVSSPHPPALPPRPPPRPRPAMCSGGSPGGCCSQGDTVGSGTSPPTPAHYEPAPDHIGSHTHQQTSATAPAAPVAANDAHPYGSARRRFWSAALRKYVILCTACGGMAALLGALFLLVHLVLRAHTSSLHYFETVPTYVPAAMLTVTGLVVMCFARRRNRYGYLIKVCGVCCLLCAVLCVVVTVTTTVIHMNRLQTLRECVYAKSTRTCTCYSGLAQEPAPSATDDGMRFVFHSTADCEVVHGALYSCLRALFGLSVIGILVCIFSCMLVYQLLSHEKKKMYWEQLEMRCRYLYGRRNPQYAYCGCSCDECPRFPPASTAATPHAEMFPWPPWEQPGYLDDRYWSPPRVGNLYTPNPEDQSAATSQQPAQHAAAGSHARWSWLPWNRGAGTTGPPCPTREEQPTNLEQRTCRGEADSQYGFGAATRGTANNNPPRGTQIVPVCRPIAAQAFVTETSGSSGGLLPRYLWGPPPPYSQPPSSGSTSSATSPVRTAPDPQVQPTSSCFPRHHHPHHHMHHVHHVPALHRHLHCEQVHAPHPGSPQHGAASPVQSPNSAARRSVAGSPCCGRIRTEDVLKAELPSSGGGGNNTLPLRKPKKRPAESPVNAALANIKAGSQQQGADSGCASDSTGRKGVGLASSLRGLFTPGSPSPRAAQRVIPQSAPTSAANSPHKPALGATTLSPLRRLPPPPCVRAEPTESEVYFADVSSCNGGPDSSLYDEPNAPEPRGDAESAQYASIPTPPPPGSRMRRARYAERLAPDAQYELRSHDVSAAQEDDAPMRDSDATIDSGVHSGSEAALQAASNRMRPALRVQDEMLPPRSVNV